MSLTAVFPLVVSFFAHQVPLLPTLGFAVCWLVRLPRSYSSGVTNASAGGEEASSAWTGSVRSRKVTEIGAGKGTCLFPRLAECRLPCWRAAIDAKSTTGVLR